MKKEELQKLSTDYLQKKDKGNKTLVGMFIGLIAFFTFILGSDYLNGKELNILISGVAACTLGGLASVWPEFNAIRKELKSRKN